MVGDPTGAWSVKRLKPGDQVDQYKILSEAHRGGMARLYLVQASESDSASTELLMKVPRMSPRDQSETVLSFEVERLILPRLKGRYIPKLIAIGELDRVPYILMQRVEAETMADWLVRAHAGGTKPSLEVVVQLGISIAYALFSLHRQACCHHDLKPANVLIKADGQVVLVDFGLAHHRSIPDLHAEEMRQPVGSPPSLAPEQIVGLRGDPRSDIYALGVLLYVMLTGLFPFGVPKGAVGLSRRLWDDPVPLRQLRPDLPAWLQEVIGRCLKVQASDRYQSAAHLVFDLKHPQQVRVGGDGLQTKQKPVWQRLRAWFGFKRLGYRASQSPTQAHSVPPIVMLALNHADPSERVRQLLGESAKRAMGSLPGARLALVTVLLPREISDHDDQRSRTEQQRRHLVMLRQLAQQLNVDLPMTSCHVLEGQQVATTIVKYAEANHVNTIVLGSGKAEGRLQTWAHSVAVKVAMHAPCTVVIVKLDDKRIDL
ncbi:MAG: serine/threonine protein kinase [Betaproteobacteria bacterium]